MEIKRNEFTGGDYCIFVHNGKHYYADCSFVPYIGLETMIFSADENGNVTSWTELYCDRSGQSLEECIEEFCNE